MLTEIGAGIQVSPNASRVLHGLGLAEELASTGVNRWHGTSVAGTTAGPLCVHRSLSHSKPCSALRTTRCIAPTCCRRLRLGCPPTACISGTVSPAWRTTAIASRRCSRTVPAPRSMCSWAPTASTRRAQDAIRAGESPVHRVRRVPGPGAGRTASELGLEVTAQVWMGPGQHFVHYFVSGGRLVNFVAVIEQDTWTRESWTDRGDPADALAAYAGWHPQVRAILEAVDETFIWALFDHIPLERWSAGRVTLLGDACHAMLPFMAQGAAQAIEDAATLASVSPARARISPRRCTVMRSCASRECRASRRCQRPTRGDST